MFKLFKKKDDEVAKKVIDPYLKTCGVTLFYNHENLFHHIVGSHGHNEDEAIEIANNFVADNGFFGRYVSRERTIKRLTVSEIIEVSG